MITLLISIIVFRCLTDGGGISYGGLSFPGTGCLALDVGNIYFLVRNDMGHCFCIYPPPDDVSVHELFFFFKSEATVTKYCIITTV